MSAHVKGTDEKYCYECGEIIRAKAEICPKCGVRQPVVYGTSGAPSFQGSRRNPIVVALFALFLGIGIHKFYLGRKSHGVAYLLFCWTFIPAVIALIEGISYLSMTDEAFNAKYNDTVETQRSEAVRLCKKCGEQLSPTAKWCTHCGHRPLRS
jgi:TM2 domain-containing membrane protein YozV